VIFALGNTAPVTISFLTWHLDDQPLALVLLIAVALGILIGVLLMTPSVVKQKLALSGEKKKLKGTEKELDEHKTKLTELEEKKKAEEEKRKADEQAKALQDAKSAVDEAANRLVKRSISQNEAGQDAASGFTRLLIQLLATFQRFGGRLLKKQVVAEIHGVHRVAKVVGILSGDQQHIGKLAGSEEGLVGVKYPDLSGFAQARHRCGLGGVEICHCDELVAFRHAGSDSSVSSAPGTTTEDRNAHWFRHARDCRIRNTLGSIMKRWGDRFCGAEFHC